MSDNITINFRSKTDKLSAVTHIINALLADSSGAVLKQHAKSYTLEQLQEAATNHNVDGDIASFTDDDVEALINDNTDTFTVVNVGAIEEITDVSTVGARPRWLDGKNTQQAGAHQTASDFNPFGTAQTGAETQDDFNELDCLSTHQPDALTEAGFDTFRDLYAADAEELTAVPGIRERGKRTSQAY